MNWGVICRSTFVVLTAGFAFGAGPSPVTLRSVTVTFPDPGDLFPGPGADAINNDCLACHSREMVLTQPALPPKAWEAEIAKMRKVYKAAIDDADVAPIVAYLTSQTSAK